MPAMPASPGSMGNGSAVTAMGLSSSAANLASESTASTLLTQIVPSSVDLGGPAGAIDTSSSAVPIMPDMTPAPDAAPPAAAGPPAPADGPLDLNSLDLKSAATLKLEGRDTRPTDV
jgi:hypothetical protein